MESTDLFLDQRLQFLFLIRLLGRSIPFDFSTVQSYGCRWLSYPCDGERRDRRVKRMIKMFFGKFDIGTSLLFGLDHQRTGLRS